MTLPQIAAAGTLVADPELRFTQSGKPFLKGRIACNDRVRDESAPGGWRDGDATFISWVLFGQGAENGAESFIKGDRVVVTGRLKQNDYETSEGEKRTTYEIMVDSLGADVLFRPYPHDQQATKRQPQTVPASPAEDEPPF